MKDLIEYLRGVRERIDAAKYMDTAAAYALHDAPTQAMSMKIAIRTAAWPLIQKAPSDLATLTEICETLMEAVEFYSETGNVDSEGAYLLEGNVYDQGETARQAKVRVEKILDANQEFE